MSDKNDWFKEYAGRVSGDFSDDTVRGLDDGISGRDYNNTTQSSEYHNGYFQGFEERRKMFADMAHSRAAHQQTTQEMIKSGFQMSPEIVKGYDEARQYDLGVGPRPQMNENPYTGIGHRGRIEQIRKNQQELGASIYHGSRPSPLAQEYEPPLVSIVSPTTGERIGFSSEFEPLPTKPDNKKGKGNKNRGGSTQRKSKKGTRRRRRRSNKKK